MTKLKVERTLVLIKPNVNPEDAETIRQTYREAGLEIVRVRDYKPAPESLVRAHYAGHEDKPYWDRLLEFMTQGRTQALVLQGLNAISVVRNLNGATDPTKADPDSIRARFGENATLNAVHASDSEEASSREEELWLPR